MRCSGGSPLGRLIGAQSRLSGAHRLARVNPSFDTFVLPEEHRLLRKTVREVADDKIAPRAAEIDESAELPYDVLKALVEADLHAVHVPEAYGRGGADALASAILIDGTDRARCA